MSSKSLAQVQISWSTSQGNFHRSKNWITKIRTFADGPPSITSSRAMAERPRELGDFNRMAQFEAKF